MWRRVTTWSDVPVGALIREQIRGVSEDNWGYYLILKTKNKLGHCVAIVYQAATGEHNIMVTLQPTDARCFSYLRKE
jgi:hypothetical protein